MDEPSTALAVALGMSGPNRTPMTMSDSVSPANVGLNIRMMTQATRRKNPVRSTASARQKAQITSHSDSEV